MSPEDFKKILLTKSAEDIVAEHITTPDPGPHLNTIALDFLSSQARVAFQLKPEQQLSPLVVGSAKLGFSIVEKRKPNATFKPRYRNYDPNHSDIDVAIVSPALYGKIWSGLARHGANQRYFPWESKLGTYMYHGWIRPDKFPEPPPQQCLDWRKFMYQMNSSKYFQYRKLRCAIYHSIYFLNLYQTRGVLDAQNAEIII